MKNLFSNKQIVFWNSNPWVDSIKFKSCEKNKGDDKSFGVNGQNERIFSIVFLWKSKWNDLKTHKKSNCNEYFRFACHKIFFVILYGGSLSIADQKTFCVSNYNCASGIKCISRQLFNKNTIKISIQRAAVSKRCRDLRKWNARLNVQWTRAVFVIVSIVFVKDGYTETLYISHLVRITSHLFWVIFFLPSLLYSVSYFPFGNCFIITLCDYELDISAP